MPDSNLKLFYKPDGEDPDYTVSIHNVSFNWYVRGTDVTLTLRVYWAKDDATAEPLYGLGLTLAQIAAHASLGSELVAADSYVSAKLSEDEEYTGIGNGNILSIGNLAANAYQDIDIKVSIPNETAAPGLTMSRMVLARLSWVTGYSPSQSGEGSLYGGTIYGSSGYSVGVSHSENDVTDIDWHLISIFVLNAAEGSDMETLGIVFEETE